MYKSEFNSSNKNVILFILGFILFAISCTNSHKEELKHLNALQEQLDSNAENLNIDDPIFSARAKYIDSVLRIFKNKYTGNMDENLGNNLSRYKAIKKNYTHQTRELEKSRKEQSELTKQLENLAKDVHDGKLSKDEFKSYYSTEKIDVQALIAASSNIKKTLYEVEPEYARITKDLQPYLDSMKARKL
jgi:undecaprenyl pyrophosphate synthase